MFFKTTSLRRAAASVACMLPLWCYALSEEPLDMIYEAPPVSSPSRDDSGAAVVPLASRPCALSFQLTDVRPSKTTLGAGIFMLGHAGGTPIAMQSIRGGDGLPWLRGAMRSLQNQRISLAESAIAQDSTATGQNVGVQLQLAHAWPEGMNLAATVVLEARYRAPTGDLKRTYVGQGMKLNWANGDGEFMGVLNAAMADAITFLARDVVSLCEGRALTASLP
ncbi:hypothetical protein [Acidovorax sp.]|uniref:hypothetical protein n=1 Tax=Acidovorax sp. TaxID=1872122 RepID=UPI002611EA4F|nr:hypothetical protein [Acidovorax sp.]